MHVVLAILEGGGGAHKALSGMGGGHKLSFFFFSPLLSVINDQSLSRERTLYSLFSTYLCDAGFFFL